MTEKHYGGSSKFGIRENKVINNKNNDLINMNNKKSNATQNKDTMLQEEEINKIKDAGKIAKQVIDYAKSIISPGMPLLEIANKIDKKIIELNAKPAFPVNLSIDEIAAHSTPSWDDKTLAHGLLKVDIGIHLDGYVADTSFSIDLDNKEENKRLIQSVEEALQKALEKADIDIRLGEIGKIIEKTISSAGFQAVRNLSGHSIERYNLHSGITVPNFNNPSNEEFSSGVYAVEPFATNGLGAVRDGKPSGIFSVSKEGNVREESSREVLSFILKEYKTLPFCSRWIYEKFGSKGLLALRRIEMAGILHQYPQLVERGAGVVAQAEHTMILTPKEKIITTK
jgi:methionyl aminopeptidase